VSVFFGVIIDPASLVASVLVLLVGAACSVVPACARAHRSIVALRED
jgi:hypothetical protein